jgi:SAM-dependent methyltransferase
MQFIVCPICREPMRIGPLSSICTGGHEFPVKDGILDLLGIDDNDVLEEEQHWDNLADKGRMKFEPNEYIRAKIDDDYRDAFEECIKIVWSGRIPSYVNMVEIGCGSGSAITYLNKVEFQKVEYVGIDVSTKIMRIGISDEAFLPDNWNIQFVRSSAEIGIFKESSIDLVFSSSALHHLNLNSVFEWVSNSLRPNGLLILHEPTINNPFARIGRKVVRGFHTKGERPLVPNNIKDLASSHNLNLVYEKGLHFLNGSVQYLIGMIKLPFPITFCVYHICRFFDSLILSPSWNYSFLQVYRK